MSKSKIVHFGNNQTERSDYEFKYGNGILDYVSSYKYLGVTLNEYLKYDKNEILLAEAAGRSLGSVVAKYKSHTFMGYKTYSQLYNSCVCPVMDYSSGVWGYNHFEKAESVQHKAMRIFLGVHRFAPILALEGDFAWVTPRHRRWIIIVRVWNRFVQMSEDRLTYQIFVNDYCLALSNYDN
jgi:hypothetical protein